MKHSIGITLAAGATTTVFTVPLGYKANVELLYISNNTASNKTIDAYWQHAHNAGHQIYLAKAKTINTKDYFILNDADIVMQAGDTLKITTEAAGDFAVITTFDLYKEAPIQAFNGE